MMAANHWTAFARFMSPTATKQAILVLLVVGGVSPRVHRAMYCVF